MLEALDDGSFRMLAGRAAELASELQKVIAEAGLAVQVPVVESLVGIFFTDETPRDFQESQAADAKTYARFFHAMLERGIALPPSPFEVLFPSLAHTRGELERTVDLAAAGKGCLQQLLLMPVVAGVDDGPPLRQAVEWRLRQEEMPLFDQPRHLAVEECHQQ